MTIALGLTRVSLPMLEHILVALESGRLACPLSESDLIDAGFHGSATAVVESLAVVDTASAIAAELAGQWRQLVSEGLVRKYEG